MKNGRSGASPIPGFVLLQKYCSPIRLQYFKFSRRSGYRHYAYYYIQYTSIHNYYITVQNKSGYRAGTRPSVFRAKVRLHPTNKAAGSLAKPDLGAQREVRLGLASPDYLVLKLQEGEAFEIVRIT